MSKYAQNGPACKAACAETRTNPNTYKGWTAAPKGHCFNLSLNINGMRPRLAAEPLALLDALVVESIESGLGASLPLEACYGLFSASRQAVRRWLEVLGKEGLLEVDLDDGALRIPDETYEMAAELRLSADDLAVLGFAPVSDDELPEGLRTFLDEQER